jgi:hypothetical protein
VKKDLCDESVGSIILIGVPKREIGPGLEAEISSKAEKKRKKL